MPVTKTDRISLNGVWTDALTLRSGSGNAQGFWVLPRIVEQGDSLSFVLSAMSAAKLLFDGTLPADRAQVFPVRIDHRVLGKYVLEGLEPSGSLDSVRLALRRVESATADEQPVSHDLGVLSAQSWGALCMDAATGELIRIACSGAKDLVPGESVRILVRNNWTKGKTRFVSGELEQPVVDVARLRLKPLALTRLGDWDPAEDAWHGQEDVPAWWRAIVNRGPRPEYELENVLPAADNDPILQAIEYRDAGDLHRLPRVTLVCSRKVTLLVTAVPEPCAAATSVA